MSSKFLLLFFSFLFFGMYAAVGQTYGPIAVSGFNQDVVAESGTSSLTTTTSSLDGVTVSNKVMYTATFRTTNGFAGGGIPDNGTIVNGTSTYQLAAYNGNNAFVIPRSTNNDITLTTPAKYSNLRLLGFSTEGSSLVNVTLFFTDGTNQQVLTNYSLSDWFNGTTNVVLSGFGRCTRATPANGADAYPNNPILYYIQVPISCANSQKLISKINVANVTTAGSNAPYPNTCIFAASGVSYAQTITSGITPATCTTNGSVTLNITGTTGPYSVTWNTSPVQNGTTATNLSPNTYTATITDANSCVTTFPVTISQTNNLTLSPHLDTTICPGASFNSNMTSNGTSFTWSPVTGVSNPSAVSPMLNPTVTTPYTVTAFLGSCSLSRNFTVFVSQPITLIAHIDTTICPGASFNANTISNGTTFTWTPTAGVSNSTAPSPILSPTVTTPYIITATTGVCSVSRSFTVFVQTPVAVNAGPDVTISQGSSTVLQGTAGAGTYLWTPSTGLSNTNILTPTASPVATTTYRLTVTSGACSYSDDVVVTVISQCIKPMNAISPNGDGINDRWLVASGGCATNIKARIYNRYGHLIYKSDNYSNDWEGTYEGKPAPDGTYYYVVEFDSNGNHAFVRGDVTILR